MKVLGPEVIVRRIPGPGPGAALPPFLRPLPCNGTILPHAAVAYAIWMDALGRLYTTRHTYIRYV